MSKAMDFIKKNTMLFALAFVMILFQVLIVTKGKGSLFTPTNVANLINQNSYVVILATGMLMCILSGGNIDLSVGSIVAFVGALAGILIVNMKMNIYLSIILCLIAGTLIGAWQAFWIAYVRIPPFIVTLSGMLTFRGLAIILLNGLTISPFPEEYTRYFNSYITGGDDPFMISIIIGVIICVLLVAYQLFIWQRRSKKGYEVETMTVLVTKLAVISVLIMCIFYLLGKGKGIPIILLLIAVVVLIYGYFTSNTVPGRYLYAMGGNEKAARLSGIDTDRVLFFAYTNMGFLSAVAALVCVARFNSAAPSAGTNYEMDAIASCYIGGASAFGGVGTVGGAVIGATFMGVLNNGMSILGIDANWQKAVKGMVLLLAVIFDVVSKKRRETA